MRNTLIRSGSVWLFLIVLLGCLLQVSAAFAAAKVPTRAGTKYLEIRNSAGTYDPIFVKGINLSVALPGKHPSEFPYDEELYREWLYQISEMNCNVIRVYTIHPPEMYRALKYHNTTYPDRTLWLMQGVWAVAPPERDYLDKEYMDLLESDLRRGVDVVHGNAVVHPRPGQAEGVYKADVSPWLLAWLLGREWEPDDLLGFQKLYPNYTDYQGKNISAHDAQPIECWLARLCDYTVSYEEQVYKVLHPAGFSSWPPTDPLNHESESNIEEEEELAGIESEGRVEIFSNDAVNITCKHFTVEDNNKAGIFASYHIYPYWPDFIDNEPEYTAAEDRYGPSNYHGYLLDLKSYYNDMPLMVAEYGLPNGPLTGHQQNQGWHHGGLSEADVAREMPRLTESIFDSGCAGGIAFAWIDEWFKKVWVWAEFYDPWMDRRLWYNFYDAEENYGMIAMLPGVDGPTCSLSGNPAEWEEATAMPGGSASTEEDAPEISSVEVMHDEGFLHVRIKIDNFDDWEFWDNGLYVGFDILGIDSFGDNRGNLSWPGPLKLGSDTGLEEAVSFAAGEARLWQTESFRFWEPYRVKNSRRPRYAEVFPHVLEEEDNRWKWFEPIIETNRLRVGRTGEVFEHKTWNLNPLQRGSLIVGADDYNDQACWNVNADEGCLELRMPWILLGFVGPHQSRVIQAAEDGSNSSEISEGVGLAVVLTKATGTTLTAWPGLADDVVVTSAAGRYSWEDWTWEDITYHTRTKPIFHSMAEVFDSLSLD